MLSIVYNHGGVFPPFYTYGYTIDQVLIYKIYMFCLSAWSVYSSVSLNFLCIEKSTI